MIRRYTPLKKISNKQQQRMRLYRPISELFLADKECAVVINGRHLEGCKLLASKIHHAKGRIGELLYDTEFFIPVCSGPCHAYLEANPAVAFEIGLSISRHKK